MTNKEAIDKLKDRYLGMSCYVTIEECKADNTALDMAIEALEKQDALKTVIEQLVKERDAAVKCIKDIETYLQMGSAKYIDKTIKEWRGVTDDN